MRVLVLACLALGLSACTTLTQEERRAIDEDTCRSYGFRPGTDAFAACLQRIDLDRRADARANRAEFDRWASRPAVIYQPVYVPVRRN
ncbi:hypothetical protein GTW25_02550 [Aliihoeflea aestuarii]|uniref:hypothetical protein n=1 Tax=Aliihoeflea aestuarii TaxID=453840 RepID=UPI0035566ACF|nr:hypothetical protein [Aliihoeflea aestuarii]